LLERLVAEGKSFASLDA